MDRQNLFDSAIQVIFTGTLFSTHTDYYFFASTHTWGEQGATLLNMQSTLKVRPGMLNVGQFPKNMANLSAFIVADVTINFKSERLAVTFFKSPNSTSVFKDRSCASSMMIAEYSSKTKPSK